MEICIDVSSLIFPYIQLENCIGSAVIAMGPEKVLTDVPITLNASEFTCSNIWLVPILKNYVVGASLEYYMQHILRLAKSFREASRKGISLTFISNVIIIHFYMETQGLFFSSIR